jgi:CHAD domain-containing protein
MSHKLRKAKLMIRQIQGTTPLWIAARFLLYERVDDFFRHRDKVLKTFDPEDIHDLRVACRRLREGMSLFAPCYCGKVYGILGKKLKQVTRLLGDMRNTDEAILFFTELARELGGPCCSSLEQLASQFRENRKRGLKRLKTGLREILPDSGINLFRKEINSPTLFNPAENNVDLLAPLTGFAGYALDGRLSKVLQLIPAAGQPDAIEAQHMLRIAVKHFRYRMELLAFLIGPAYDELHGAVKDYQDVLGKMHDLDVFAGIVRDAAIAPQTEKTILDAIAAKRETLFADFCAMQAACSFEKIGSQVTDWPRS